MKQISFATKTNMVASKKKKIIKRNIKKVSYQKKRAKLSQKPRVKIVKKTKKAPGRKILQRKKIKKVKLVRATHNPIIEPSKYVWESKATLNPSAFIDKGKVHLIYRAIGDNDSSVLGYAASSDGYNINDRLPTFIYQRSNNFNKPDQSLLPIHYVSGGGWNGGCEDPRLTLLGGIVYMLYTAFDGWGSVRIALTSIKLNDFKKKKWLWKKPVLISPPHEINKNWVIFPEKINGKFAILHSLSPEILIEYVNRMEDFDGTKFIESVHQGSPKWQLREKGMRGVGPAPIKTELGWLILYHAIEEHDPNRYKLFAMILDLKNPTKILYRNPNPILEPEKYYENNGYKWGVVYSCGAVVKDGKLFVYYGGADKVIGVASISLAELLLDLRNRRVTKMRKQSTEI